MSYEDLDELLRQENARVVWLHQAYALLVIIMNLNTKISLKLKKARLKSDQLSLLKRKYKLKHFPVHLKLMLRVAKDASLVNGLFHNSEEAQCYESAN